PEPADIVMVIVVHDAVREAELEQLLKGFLRPGRLYIDVLRGLYIEISLLRVPHYLGPKGLSLFRGGFFYFHALKSSFSGTGHSKHPLPGHMHASMMVTGRRRGASLG